MDSRSFSSFQEQASGQGSNDGVDNLMISALSAEATEFSFLRREYYSNTDSNAPINSADNITGDNGLMYTPELLQLHHRLWSTPDDEVLEFARSQREYLEDEWKVFVRRLFVCVPGGGVLQDSGTIGELERGNQSYHENESPVIEAAYPESSLAHVSRTSSSYFAHTSEATQLSGDCAATPVICCNFPQQYSPHTAATTPSTTAEEYSPPHSTRKSSFSGSPEASGHQQRPITGAIRTSANRLHTQKPFLHVPISKSETKFTPTLIPGSIRCQWSNTCSFIFPYALESDVKAHYTKSHPEALNTSGSVKCQWPKCNSKAKHLVNHVLKQHVDVWVRCGRCQEIITKKDIGDHLEIINIEVGLSSCGLIQQRVQSPEYTVHEMI